MSAGGPLPRDYHLSEEALAFYIAHPVGNTGGRGGYGLRREGHRKRVEETIEVERRAGRLFTPEDVARWLRRQLMLPPTLEEVEEMHARLQDAGLHRNGVTP